MMMSTSGKGKVTSSILPWRRVILLDIPLAATISLAFSMIEDMSTPMTCLAPALTANLIEINVSKERWQGCGTGYLHGQDGSATTNIEDNLVFEDVAVLVHGISVGESTDLIFL